MTDIREVLGISLESPFWEEAVAAAEKMPATPAWLTEDYICKIDDAYQLLGDKREMVLNALHRVVSDPALCIFTKVLYYIIGLKKGFKDAFPQLELPKRENFVGIFPIMGHIAPSRDALRKRNVPEDVIFDTLSFFRMNIPGCFEQEVPRFGETVFSYFPLYLYTDNLCMGRLRFEIHPGDDRNVAIFENMEGKACILMCNTRLHASGQRLGAIGFTDETGSFDGDFVETDTYYEGYKVNETTCLAENIRTRLSKAEWTQVYKPGDTVLKVHIPIGGKLTPEACHASYEKARKIYKAGYPEHDFKGFFCNTWFLNPALGTFLPPESNIMQFQKDYRIFPAVNNAPDVFHYVYHIDVPSADMVDAQSLPENNSMQRGVKDLLQKGIYVHQCNGYIPF